MQPPLTWQCAVRAVVKHTSVFATTSAILRDFLVSMGYEVDTVQIMAVVEQSDFFHPRGLARLADEIGMPPKELEQYEIKLGLRSARKK